MFLPFTHHPTKVVIPSGAEGLRLPFAFTHSKLSSRAEPRDLRLPFAFTHTKLSSRAEPRDLRLLFRAPVHQQTILVCDVIKDSQFYKYFRIFALNLVYRNDTASSAVPRTISVT